jgi:hypothetical protein
MCQMIVSSLWAVATIAFDRFLMALLFRKPQVKPLQSVRFPYCNKRALHEYPAQSLVSLVILP